MVITMKKLILFLFFPLLLFSQEITLIGDVDCNGEVNSEDASLILQYVTSVIDSLPCQENMSGLTPSTFGSSFSTEHSTTALRPISSASVTIFDNSV